MYNTWHWSITQNNVIIVTVHHQAMITPGLATDWNALQGKSDVSNTPFHRHYNMINDTETIAQYRAVMTDTLRYIMALDKTECLKELLLDEGHFSTTNSTLKKLQATVQNHDTERSRGIIQFKKIDYPGFWQSYCSIASGKRRTRHDKSNITPDVGANMQ